MQPHVFGFQPVRNVPISISVTLPKFVPLLGVCAGWTEPVSRQHRRHSGQAGASRATAGSPLKAQARARRKTPEGLLHAMTVERVNCKPLSVGSSTIPVRASCERLFHAREGFLSPHKPLINYRLQNAPQKIPPNVPPPVRGLPHYALQRAVPGAPLVEHSGAHQRAISCPSYCALARDGN
jgi:hypothetical protein